MAITFDQLKKILFSAADPAYLRPFFEGAYGNGREAFEAFLAVLQRTDEAIERTTQALYISPWSGQTAPPAMGSSRTRLQLEVTRGNRSELPITIGAGAVLFGELARDWGENGGQDVETGRQYTLLADLTLMPGEAGPITVDVSATRIGYGFANPAPGTIKKIVQPGASFQNSGASVLQGPGTARLITRPVPDALTAAHVGQYVQFVGGANIGAVRRIVGYEPPTPGVNGGIAVLAGTFVGRSTTTAPVGTFTIGEQVVQFDTTGPTIVAEGVVLAVSSAAPWFIVIDTLSGQFTTTALPYGPITGVMSGATFTTDVPPPAANTGIVDSGKLVNEVQTCTWRVLDWGIDLGIAVQNPEGSTVRPGAYPMLDSIGAERDIARSPGEPDDLYRKRVSAVADIVSPNAIRRIGNRIWAPYSGSVCLREIGQARFAGLYCDGDPGSTSDLSKYAYDFDGKVLLRGTTPTGHLFFEGERVYQDDGAGILTYARVTKTIDAAAPGSIAPTSDPNLLEVAVDHGPGFVAGLQVIGETSGQVFVPGGVLYPSSPRPQDRFKVLVDYTEFRAFFLLGIPPEILGEFGVPFDAPHPYNAFDAAPYLTFFDGFPLTSAVLAIGTWQAVDRARAGGVGFDLYEEDIGCI